MNEELVYSIPYIFFILFIIIIIFIEFSFNIAENQKKYIRWICITLFIIFFGFRGFIGWDWIKYYKMFENTPTLFNFSAEDFKKNAFIEPGYIIYMSFFKTIFGNYTMFVLGSSIINISIINIFLKRYSSIYSFGFLCFILMGGFNLATDLMRNSLSISIFLYSLKYLQNRKLLPYLLFNLFGLLFHSSSILFIPLYFVLNLNTSRKFFIIAIVIGNVLFLSQFEYLKPIIFSITKLIGFKYDYLAQAYLNNPNYGKAYGISIGYLERLFTSILIIIYYDRILLLSKFNKIFVNAFLIYFFLYLFFAEIFIIPVRFGMLLVFSYWVLWPALLKCIVIPSNKYIFLILINFYFNVKIIFLSKNILYAYDNVLTSSLSYEDRADIFRYNADRIMKSKAK